MKTFTVPAAAIGAKGSLEYDLLFSFTGSTNQKDIRIYFGGGAGVGTKLGSATVTTANQSLRMRGVINNTANNAQKAMDGSASGTGASGAAVASASIDTTSAQDLVITVQLANSGETISLEFARLTVNHAE